MLIGVTVFALLASVTINTGLILVNKIRSRDVLSDLQAIQIEVDKFYKANSSYPDSLDEIYPSPQLDPWSMPYQYLRIKGGPPNVTGKQRKYKSLKVNSSYDLYSMGPDQETASPLTASISKDDIIRGRNGDFLGYVIDFQ
jgi:general secretion pathway protein G